MEISLASSWQKMLSTELEKDYFKELLENVASEYASNECYPSKELIFNHNNKVLKFSNIETISVVDLYKRICKIINKKENFELSDYQEKIPSIDNSQEVIDILKKLNIITENYTDKILTKYLKKWSY